MQWSATMSSVCADLLSQAQLKSPFGEFCFSPERRTKTVPIAGMAIKFETTNIHYSIIEGCLFLEHMPSENNAINLKCKFAFIQLNGRYIYYNKKD